MSKILEHFEKRQEAIKIASDMVSQARREADAPISIHEIDWFLLTPKAELSADVLTKGLAASRSLFSENNVQPSGDYAESAKRLFTANPLTLSMIHGAFISDAMVEEFVARVGEYDPTTEESIYRVLSKKDGFEPGPVYVNGSVSENISNVYVLSLQHIPMILDETLIDAVKKCPDRVSILFAQRLNRPDLLTLMIADGFEPNVFPGIDVSICNASMPIKTLLSNLAAYESSTVSGPNRVLEQACWKGLIKRHPVKDVFAVAGTNEEMDSLIGMYSARELLPLVRHDRYAKGALLSSELGI